MIRKLFIWLITVLFFCVVIIPLVWIFISSFKTNIEFFSSPYSLPNYWTLKNYINSFSREPLLLYLSNSVVVAAVSTLLNILITLPASYVFLHEFPFKKVFFVLIIFGLFVPLSAFILPYFLIVSWLGLYDSLWGLIIVYTGISAPLSFLIIHTYIQEIVNREIIEAATLDGASFHQIFIRIVAPLSKGGVATATIFSLMIAWNELLYAMILTQSESSRTIQMAIRFLVATFYADYPTAFAAIIISILPMVLIYSFLNRYIVKGLAMINK